MRRVTIQFVASDQEEPYSVAPLIVMHSCQKKLLESIVAVVYL